MKIFIPSKGRAETIRTHKYLERGNIPYKIVLHYEADKREYLKNPSVKEENIIVSNQPYGVANQRRWIRDQLEMGEKYLLLDDNIDTITGLPEPDYSTPIDVTTKPHLFKNELTPEEFMERVKEMFSTMEKTGAKFGGLAVVDNYYFRERKYRHVGYVISKVALIEKSEATYDYNLEAMEDYGFTAENLLIYGRVLINNFMFPVAGHYEKGGIGTYPERLPRKIKDCEYLMQKYPKLFRYKVKKGCHPKAELQVRFTSIKQLEEWRKSFTQSSFNIKPF
jgi:hypothetical protein